MCPERYNARSKTQDGRHNGIIADIENCETLYLNEISFYCRTARV